MFVDSIGTLKPFADVKLGEFFLHFAGGECGLAMKVFNEASPTTVAVLAFTERPHPSMTGPCIILPPQFENRDVLVIPSAVVRPSYNGLTALNDGSPKRLDDYGALIFSADTALVRAYVQHGSMDVNLRTGASKSARAHPGSMWVDDWEIVVPTVTGDLKIFERPQTAKAAA